MFDLTQVELPALDFFRGAYRRRESLEWAHLVNIAVGAESFESGAHYPSVANVLHFLELISRVFYHQLEALWIVLAIFSVDKVVYTASDTLTLVGWQDKHLGDFGAMAIE